MDVAAFLAEHPPFDGLDPDRLETVAGNVRVEYFPEGTVILQGGGDPAAFLYVVRKGAVELLDEDTVLDVLVEGEAFGQLSLLSGLGPVLGIRAHEDTICYLIEADVAEQVLGTKRGLAFFSAMMRRQFIRAEEQRGASRSDPTAVSVGSLVARRPVTCAADATVREAADVMAKERVSSLVIPRNGSVGILTDRDLRTRVLAAGLSAETPVAEVMTHPAITVPPDTMAGEVLSMMLEHGFHHFPVTEHDGSLIGVVTDTDLMRMERHSPVALKSAIERAPDRASLIAAGRDLTKVVMALVDSRSDPVDVGHVVGVTVDALTRRSLELSMQEVGDPPVPWAWLALGSAARHEQALHSDQDHALAYDPLDRSPTEVEPYFAELTKRVTDDLERVGLPRCSGNAMAENPQLRRSLEEWAAGFREWMNDPGLEGSILTSIVFDYRRVTGPLEVDRTLDALIRTAPGQPLFLRHLVRRALDGSPPTGFLRDLVVEAKGEHAGTLDVKHRGITLITSLARTYAISAGITEKRTLARLQAARIAGRIDEETRAGLAEAFRLLWGVRLRHQAAQARAGQEPDNHVDPGMLGPLERRALKEAFRAIARAQRGLANEAGVRVLR
jgi:CBS domain-containing protein